MGIIGVPKENVVGAGRRSRSFDDYKCSFRECRPWRT